MTTTTIKGELKLCAAGQKLFDDYCNKVETNNHVGHISEVVKEVYANKAWKAYQDHRMNCDECGYE